MLHTSRTITLNEDDLKQMESLIGEIPTKFGLPLITLLEDAQKRTLVENIAEEINLESITQ